MQNELKLIQTDKEHIDNLEKETQTTIVCSVCGKTNVTCEAYINPNTGEIDHFSDESFDHGWCKDCKYGFPLTDVEDTQKDFDNKLMKYVDENGKPPRYAECKIVINTSDENDEDDKSCIRKNAVIKLSCGSDGEKDNDVLYFCNGLLNLRDFITPNENFTILWCNKLF